MKTLEEKRAYWRNYRILNLEKRREQARVNAKKNRDKNIDKARAYGREWYRKKTLANPDWIKNKKHSNLLNNQRIQREAKARMRDRNPEKARSDQRNWQKKNPEKMRAYQAKRKAMRKNNLHPLADPVAIKSLHVLAHNLKTKTGGEWHVDHIIPVSAGGWEHELNMQLLPHRINSSKHDNPFWVCAGYKNWMDVPRWLWPDSLVPFYLVAELNLGRAA